MAYQKITHETPFARTVEGCAGPCQTLSRPALRVADTPACCCAAMKSSLLRRSTVDCTAMSSCLTCASSASAALSWCRQTAQSTCKGADSSALSPSRRAPTGGLSRVPPAQEHIAQMRRRRIRGCQFIDRAIDEAPDKTTSGTPIRRPHHIRTDGRDRTGRDGT